MASKQLPPTRGRFFDARMRAAPSTPITRGEPALRGAAMTAWVAKELGGNSPAAELPEVLTYYTAAPFGPRPMAGAGSTGTAGADDSSFIYLDVGAWFGSSDSAWGKLRNGVRRDFAIIGGPHVLLCTFSGAWPVPADGPGIPSNLFRPKTRVGKA